MSTTTKKLLVCDVEGTIFKANYQIEGVDYASTIWQPLAKILGPDAIEEELALAKKWDSKGFNHYSEWVTATFEMHKKYGLEKVQFNKLIRDAEYKEGVVEFFENLDRDKYIPILVSGGFQELVDRALKELNIKYGTGACRYVFDGKGKLSGHKISFSDYEGKIDYLEMHAKHLSVDYYSDWVFIGDGKNDRFIANIAPVAFAIDAHEDLKKINKIHIVDDFHQVAEHLENLKDEDFYEKFRSMKINPIHLHWISKTHGYLYVSTVVFQNWLLDKLTPDEQEDLIDSQYVYEHKHNEYAGRPETIGAADLLFLLKACFFTNNTSIISKIGNTYLIDGMRNLRNRMSHINQDDFFESEKAKFKYDLKTIKKFLLHYGGEAVSDIIKEIDNEIA